jgi:hypothetical protein
MGDINSPQGRVLATLRQSAPGMNVPQAASMVAYNVPAMTIAGTQATLGAAIRQNADLSITQGRVLVAVRGRIANPTVRAWTFTLDGHDFYVLRLGNIETLVYDTLAEEWYNWDAGELPFLPLSTGINWYGGAKVAGAFGSNVLCGDDSFGSLYLMDPEDISDDNPILGFDRSAKFERVVQGQASVRGYDSISCFGVCLYGSIGQADEELTIKLETSDDSGISYVDRGTVTVVPGQTSTRVQWRSLGSMNTPGRLFRLTDNGAFTRIDALEMQETGDANQ